MKRACASCNAADRTVLVGMAPGKDWREWWLCRACWVDGLPSVQLGPAPARKGAR